MFQYFRSNVRFENCCHMWLVGSCEVKIRFYPTITNYFTRLIWALFLCFVRWRSVPRWRQASGMFIPTAFEFVEVDRTCHDVYFFLVRILNPHPLDFRGSRPLTRVTSDGLGPTRQRKNKTTKAVNVRIALHALKSVQK